MDGAGNLRSQHFPPAARACHHPLPMATPPRSRGLTPAPGCLTLRCTAIAAAPSRPLAEYQQQTLDGPRLSRPLHLYTVHLLFWIKRRRERVRRTGRTHALNQPACLRRAVAAAPHQLPACGYRAISLFSIFAADSLSACGKSRCLSHLSHYLQRLDALRVGLCAIAP